MNAPADGVPTVLVVDDDTAIRFAVRMFLDSSGFTVIEASDGVQALRQLADRPADLVLVDLFMPEMDGFELIRTLRCGHPEMKIIAMSGGNRSGNVDMLPTARALPNSLAITVAKVVLPSPRLPVRRMCGSGTFNFRAEATWMLRRCTTDC
jgi:CheY-like chemotaxis protein